MEFETAVSPLLFPAVLRVVLGVQKLTVATVRWYAGSAQDVCIVSLVRRIPGPGHPVAEKLPPHRAFSWSCWPFERAGPVLAPPQTWEV
jgi:hypothetical protein